MPQERGEDLALRSLCNPRLGCPETRPAPLSRGEGLRAAGEEAHPHLHPHLSGVSQVEARRSRPGPLRTVAPEHVRGGPIPERSLYWCHLTFLEEKKKKKCVLSYPVLSSNMQRLPSKITSGEYRSWPRTPRRKTCLSKEISCFQEIQK